MATRYWRGGTGTWNATSTANWSTTSGGSGGASVPTSADDVIFDSNSGTGTITVNTVVNCANFTVTASQSLTFSFAVAVNLYVYGNVSLPSGGSFSMGTAGLTMASTGTQTITSNGKSIYYLTILKTAGTCSLSDALSLTTSLIVTRGTFTTNNFAIATSNFYYNGPSSSTATINLGSSVLTLATVSSNTIDFSSAAGSLTFNAGTSSIIFNSSTCFLNTGTYNLTFNNCTVNPPSATTSIISINISNPSTSFNNFTFNAPSSSGVATVGIIGTLNINGTFTCSSTAAPRRVRFRGQNTGTQAVINAAAISLSDADFSDILASGVAAPFSGTRLGNCQNNTNITFPAPKTVYWNLSGVQNWSATGWATSSGGSPAVNNFPLAQDTAIFDDVGAAGTVTMDVGYSVGSVNMGSRTNSMTFTCSKSLYVFENFIANSAVTFSSTSTGLIFEGRFGPSLTSNGATFNCPITMESEGGILTLQDSLTIVGNAFGYLFLYSGTIDAAGYNVTTSGLSVGVNSKTKAIFMGSGTWTLTASGTPWSVTSSTNLTIYPQTSTILLSNSTATNRTFTGGGLTYNNLVINSMSVASASLTINNANTFNTISNTGSLNGLAIKLAANQTVADWTLQGQSGTNAKLESSSSGVQRTITKTGGGVISTDYLTIKDMVGSPSNTWYVGVNSVNGGNISGFIFNNPPSGAFFFI